MNKDPYRYFRVEARELLGGLNAELLALEKGSRSALTGLLRHAHTLKGAARVVKRMDIGDLAHALEDLLAPYRDGNEVDDAGLGHASALLESIRAAVATLDTIPAVPSAAAPGESDLDALPVISLPVAQVDGLLEHLRLTAVRTVALRDSTLRLDAVDQRLRLLQSRALSDSAGLARMADVTQVRELLASAARGISSALETLEGSLAGLGAAASEIRSIPASVLVTDLERAARDAARALNKDVHFVVEGAHVDIDAHVLFGMRSALLHVVRNAVAHGVEDAGQRRAAQKSLVGVVELRIERRGSVVSFTCRDDGAGVDWSAVRQLAARQGDLPVGSAATVADLTDLLLRGGVSTSRDINSISGRGVGLSAVREVVRRLRGEVHLSSEAGVGTLVEITVPHSLSSLPALSAEVDGTVALFPLENVRRAIRVLERDITQGGQGPQVLVDGRVVPLMSLRRALARPAVADSVGVRSVVLVEAEGALAAVWVDRVTGTRDVLVYGLPSYVVASPVVSGAALDQRGVPQLVLSPSALVHAARAGVSEASPRRRERLPLLVIDDSLTSRMLEQSILESAGYVVHVASSAEQGLEMAKGHRYALFVVDVEMPGMNGFDFIAAAQADPDLKDVPSVLVTSLGDEAHKRRGRELGARAYIVKSDFDQRVLLQTIGGLVG